MGVKYNQWAGAKIPGLQVSTPKGVSKGRKLEEETAQTQQEILAEAGEGGAKRLRDLEAIVQEDSGGEKNKSQSQKMEVEGEKPTKKPRNPQTDQGPRKEERRTKPKSFLEVMMADSRRKGPTDSGKEKMATPVRK